MIYRVLNIRYDECISDAWKEAERGYEKDSWV